MRSSRPGPTDVVFRCGNRVLAVAAALLLFASSCAGSAQIDDEIVVDLTAAPVPFDRRLLGSNAPAWIPPDRLRDPVFQQQLIDLGTTVLRMPGGSWSDGYDWLACETRDAANCGATWAARPSDFLGLLAETELQGMWTVSFNGTAQEAAALVAFFNGDVGDHRPIGVDRRGTNWGTVSRWARLRAGAGHPDPQPIELWEVGNETYGAVAGAGDQCAEWGWEEVWTCDPTEYVEGDDGHDGYLAFREAMKAVDPDILVGAVGIGGSQSEWNGWGDTMIDLAGDALDFYTVHSYGFDDAPSAEEVMDRPQSLWASDLTELREKLAARNPTRAAPVPIAVTEYNLMSTADADRAGLMAEAINALYIADTIGQMALAGVSIANHWTLVGGVNQFGSDYGVFEPDRNAPNPQYYALAMWSRFGDTVFPEVGEAADRSEFSAYSGTRVDGTVTVLAINKTKSPIRKVVQLNGATGPFSVTSDVARAPTPESRTIEYNGVTGGVTDLDAVPSPRATAFGSEGFSYVFAPYSITLLEFGAEQ